MSESPFLETVELPPPENPTTWAHIKDVICRGNLDDLYRDPACERAYRAWSKPVKAEWGSLERFIRVKRLHWNDSQQPTVAVVASAADASNGSAHQAGSRGPNAFFEDLDDESQVKMIPNHWPYNIPIGCRHWCVWSRKPITHISQLPDQHSGDGASSIANGSVAPGSPEVTAKRKEHNCSDAIHLNDGAKLASAPHAQPVSWPFPAMSRADQEELYAAVSHDGIRALVLPNVDLRAGPSVAAPVTGEYVLDFFRRRPDLAHSVDTAAALPPSLSIPASLSFGSAKEGGALVDEAEAPLEAAATRAADATMAYFSQHCFSFVLKTFPPKQGWRSVLFCNPPHLRTVPGLDHWHIMALAPEAQADQQ